MTKLAAPATTHGLWIGGEEVPAVSGATFEVENPATEETLAHVAEAGDEDVERAVAVAQEAFVAWGRTEGEERGDVLLRASQLLRDSMDEVVEVDQTGRAIREMSAQLGRLPEWYAYFGSLARTHEDTVPPFGGPYLNYTRRVPLGVVAHITPWNHPLLILTKKVAPALAAGNAIVVKPSELAPLTPLMLGPILQEAGVPDGVYNVVSGFGPTTGKALTSHPAIRKIDLTGGTETGKAIATAAGQNLARVGAELGGKASVVIFDDTDIEEAVSAGLFAAFVASGQTCVQGARMLVQRSIYEPFCRRLAERAGQIVVGDPRDARTHMGPMVSAKQLERTDEYVRIGREEGATLAAGGERVRGPEDRGHFYAPTVFNDVRNDMRVAQEEIFGPVVCVLPFDTEEEAIALANGTEFGLAAAIWTRDVRRGHRVAHQLEIGVIWINDHHRIDAASPWGGFKMSGIGRENGIVAYHGYTQIQNVMVNISDEPFDWFVEDAAGLRYS